MYNWIKNTIGFKNLVILVLTILVIAGLLRIPALYKIYKLSQFEAPVKAVLSNVVPEETLIQALNGSKTVIIGYYISFDYKVGAEDYSKTEYVPADNDVAMLYDQFTKGKVLHIKIRYSAKSPSDCYISDLKPVEQN